MLNRKRFISRDEIILDQQRDVVVVFYGLIYSANLKLEFHKLTQCSVFSVHCTVGDGLRVKFRDLASNRQNTASPKYNDDISLLISSLFISM